MGRSNSTTNRLKRSWHKGRREAFDDWGRGIEDVLKKKPLPKEEDNLVNMLAGIIVVMIVGALLSLGLKFIK